MTACAHCDGSIPHRHDAGDQDALRVRERAQALRRWSVVRGGIALGLLGVVAVVGGGARAPGTVSADPWLAVLAGGLAWSLTTAAGLLVAGALHRPGQADEPARGHGSYRALALGSVAAAAATPIAALLVVLVLPGGQAGAAGWTTALGAAAGWVATALTADILGALRLRTLLLAADRGGDAARAAAARGPALRFGRHLAGTTAAGGAFATWTLALGVLPVLVFVLVPLHAALAALVAGRRAAARVSPGRATLRA